MRGLFGVVVVAVGLCGLGFSFAATRYDAGLRSSVELTLWNNNAQCTGTYVLNKHTIITATHCITQDDGIVQNEGPVQVDTLNTTYSVVANDDHDHVLLRVGGIPEGKRPARLRIGPIAKGEPVYLWGNPFGYRDVLRIGYYMGAYTEGDKLAFSMNTINGDSGSAYFNRRGEVIAVNWGYTYAPPNTSLARPLSFTATQLAAAN